MRRGIAVGLLLVAALIAGCSQCKVRRLVDPATGIVCYRCGEAISCLPLVVKEPKAETYERASVP